MDNTRTVTDAKQQKIKIKKDVITSSMSTIVDRTCYVFLVGKPEGERRSRRRWGDNIEMDLQEVTWAAWTGLICLGIGTG
jgi:hypothetical protein